ncbi:hypothetical protein ACFO3O_12810 [Dokdonia ponticola]|uniref:Uncharacterized protein n=1 Tax=Dokdonia ponticola TaxID=2041041 RepID=A0ABV9HZ86_9FLAO
MENKKEESQKEKDKSKLLDIHGFEIVKSPFLGNRKVVKHNAEDRDRLHGGLLD